MNGQSLLSGQEQNLMTDFFSHPDEFNGKHVAFGYYEEPPPNAVSSTVAPPSQAHLNALAQASLSHESSLNFSSTNNNNINNINTTQNTGTYSAGDINGMATYTREAMSQNDVAAANTLSGFRNGPPADSETSFALDGASWGAMSMSGLIKSPVTGFGSDRQWLHDSTSRSGNGTTVRRDGNGNLVEMVMGDMQRGTYAPSPAHQGRPSVQYGSDTNFTNGNFAGSPAADHTQKITNLLGIPLVAQAAGVPPNGTNAGFRRQSQPATPTQNGSSSYAPQFAPQYSAAWGGPNMGSGSGHAQPGSNKRRKSNSASGVKQEPNSDDEEHEQGSKRRKSTATTYQPGHAAMYASYAPHMQPPPQYANGPMMLPPQDVRRTNSRKKENLTDDQKRANHIVSEKKRREIINQGYRDLNDLTPALANGKSGLSRSECLTEINNYLYSLEVANARLIKDLQLDPTAFAIPPPAAQHNSGY